MVSRTNVLNMIGVPTEGVNLWYNRLRIGERIPNSPMGPPQGEERKRKKQRDEEGEKGVGALFCTEVTSNRLIRLLYKSR
jgi:hypothetical protein